MVGHWIFLASFLVEGIFMIVSFSLRLLIGRHVLMFPAIQNDNPGLLAADVMTIGTGMTRFISNVHKAQGKK